MWDPSADGSVQLVEHQCPVRDAAKACRGLCAQELEVFRRSLGEGIEVERSRHLLQEGDRCVYVLRPRGDEPAP